MTTPNINPEARDRALFEFAKCQEPTLTESAFAQAVQEEPAQAEVMRGWVDATISSYLAALPAPKAIAEVGRSGEGRKTVFAEGPDGLPPVGTKLYASPPAPYTASAMDAMREALTKLLARDERNTCQHEDTHRGGLIWEICDDCGAKWADDQGGKPEWRDPPEWIAARAALTAAQSAPVAASAIDVLAEIERLRPHYQSGTAIDQARRQLLDHFAKRFATTPVPPAPTLPRQKPGLIRARFEEWTRQHAADWNLAPIFANGKFHHYFDQETDNAWLGFVAGHQIATFIAASAQETSK